MENIVQTKIMCIFTGKGKKNKCAWAHMCYVVGLSHILETGMVCEHKALLDALRGGVDGKMGSVLRREAAH